ncbi:MAG: NEAT domain-containing protein [Candidatus Fimenecus sp.]
MAIKLKKTLALLLSVIMLSSAAVIGAFAEDVKKLSDGDITIEAESGSLNAKKLKADIKNGAKEGFHDFATKSSGVYSFFNLMHGENGVSIDLTLEKADGTDADFSGKVKITYKLPTEWDLSNGISVILVKETESPLKTISAYEIIQISPDKIKDGKITFTTDEMFKNKFVDEDEEIMRVKKFLIMQRVKGYDVRTLKDGVYDVNLSMLKSVEGYEMSMAADTLTRKATLIKQNGRYYLNATFNKGVVLNLPAFANKVYAGITKNAYASLKDRPWDVNVLPAKVLSYYDDDEVRTFAYNTIKNGPFGAMFDEESLKERINSEFLINGIKYIKNFTIDITDSFQDDNSALIGFCSDVMDSICGSPMGSDGGYNTTNILITIPKPSSKSVESLNPDYKINRKNASEIFNKYMNISGWDNVYTRSIYTHASLEKYFLTAWQRLYRSYCYVGTTQDELDSAVKIAKENFKKLEYAKRSSKEYEKCDFHLFRMPYLLNGLENGVIDTIKKKEDCTTASWTKFSNAVKALEKATENYKTDKNYLYKTAINEYIAAELAREDLELKAKDYTDLENIISEMSKMSLKDFTKQSTADFIKELSAAKEMLKKKDSSDRQIAEQISKLKAAKAALTSISKLPDGIYKVSIGFIKAVDRTSLSMADNAVNHTAKLEVKNGKYFITLDFKGITILNRFGYLSKLSYFDNGYKYLKGDKIEGNLKPVQVLTYQKNADGSFVVDKFNSENNPYPDLVKIPIVEQAINDPSGFVPLQVYVPMMDEYSKGNGTKNVLMKVNWSGAEKTTEDDEAFTPEKPVTQSPALNATDKATGISVFAEKGVFPKNTKLIVKEINDGKVFDKAKTALEDISNKFKLYDIYFVDSKGEKIQPNGIATVKYPVPKDFNTENIKLYRINDDGSKTLMSGEIKDGKFVVNHNSFSSYALVDKSVDDENNNTVKKPNTKKTSKKNNKSSNTVSAVNSVKKSSKGASVKSTNIPKTAGVTKNFATIGSLVLAGTVVIIAAKAKKRDEE